MDVLEKRQMLAVAPASDFTYTTANDQVAITRYIGFATSVEIPATINGMPVTSVANSAFFRDTRLVNVILPSSVTSIEPYAFNGCLSLEQIMIPSAVTNIGGGAFANCTSLRSITVDTANVVYSSIDGILYDKQQTTLLTAPIGISGTITISHSVTSIAGVSGLPRLEGIIVNPANEYYSSTNGILFNKMQTSLLSVPGAFSGVVTIPNSVTTIGDAAFYGCTNVTHVLVPSAVTTIGWSAFSNCSGLSSIVLPDSVTSVGPLAFFDCTSLTHIMIPKLVTSIPDRAFSGCTHLTSITVDPANVFYSSSAGLLYNKQHTSLLIVPNGIVGTLTIPGSVTSIDAFALLGCSRLTSIAVDPTNGFYSSVVGILFNKAQTTLLIVPNAMPGVIVIPNSVTGIDRGAISGCSEITGITIPETVSSIGGRRSSLRTNDCSRLASIKVDPANAFYSSIDGILYSKDQTALLQVPNAFSGVVTIPTSVTAIGDFAFFCCSNVTSVTIPSAVTTIGVSAFIECTGLMSIRMLGTPPRLKSSPQVFSGVDVKRAFVYYTSGTSGWSDTFASLQTRQYGVSDAPTSVTGVRGNGQVQLSWTAPVSNGGSAVRDYTIQYSSGSGSSWLTFTDTVSSATTATVTSLTNGRGYLFRVAAVNDVGTGSYSANSSTVTPAATPGTPTAVAGIRGNGQVQLSWTAPVSDGGLSVTDYTIQYSSNSGASWQTFTDAASSATSATVTGLTNGRGYLFRVASVNDVGMGSFIATSSSITPNAVPLPPTNIFATRGKGIVIVSWTAPVSTVGVRIIDYRVQQSTNGGLSWATVRDGVSTSTRTVVSGLVMGRDYIFRVASVGRFGAGDFSSPSAIVTPATIPAAAVGVLATGGIGQVALSWRAPTSSGGSPISQYIVQYSPSAGRWITSTTVGSNTTTATVSGLLANRSYSFRVLAVNDMGNGPVSRVVVTRTLRPALVRA